MTLPKQPYSSEQGISAMVEISENAERNGTSDMTLDGINAEIAECRVEHARKND